MSASFYRRSRVGARGFTLIELLVSMVAGLIVALAVVSLSKNVANQFYEEARANTAETSARLAAQRLRADLSRAGLMSTGNCQRDPRSAHAAGAVDGCAKSDAELQELSAFRLFTAGSESPPAAPFLYNAPAAATGLAAIGADQAPNPIPHPDSFAVFGNLTSGDEYFGSVDPAATNPCGGGKSIRLNPDDPSLLRIIKDPSGVDAPDALGALTRVFAPVPNNRFWARIADTKGFFHYATTCDTPVTLVGGIAYVHLRLPVGVLTSNETSSQFGGVDGFETVSVAPVQGAYWFLGRNVTLAHTNAGNLIENNVNPALSAQKYDLYRAWVSADQAKGVLAASAEVVAEFAVDLKLGFTVDDPSQIETSAAKMLVVGFDATAADRNNWANRSLSGAAASFPGRGTVGPHRIRSVRYRVTTRAAQPDRNENLAPAAGSDFLYRYKLGNGRYARTRVMQGEVALVNQSRMTY